MKHYISVTIGRNIDNTPMNDSRWNSFIYDIGQIIKKHIKWDGVVFSGEGVGVWDNAYENSHAYILIADSLNEPALRRGLAKLAKKYQQDAIGCAILELPEGDESLVYADK